MRRNFDYDDNEERPWEAGEYGDEEFEGGSTEPGMIDMMQLDLEAQHINNTILIAAFRLLEASWTWNFRTTKTKLKKVKEVYKLLAMLVQSRDSLVAPEEEK